MIKSIQNFFEKALQPEQAQHTELTLELAAAVLFMEVAKADHKHDEKEERAIAAALAEQFHLDKESTDNLIALAEEKMEETFSLYPFTKLINDKYSPHEKKRIIELMWRVAYADHHIDMYEEHQIRRVADLLYVHPGDFTHAKALARDQQDQ